MQIFEELNKLRLCLYIQLLVVYYLFFSIIHGDFYKIKKTHVQMFSLYCHHKWHTDISQPGSI